MYHILFFDGECRYCNRWVQWVVDRDKNRCFRFASIQSEFSEKVFRYLNIEIKDFNSIAILIHTNSGYKILKKSDAVAFIFSVLKPDALLYKLIKVLPRLFSDVGYSCVAAIRKIIPVSDCRLYEEEEKKIIFR